MTNLYPADLRPQAHDIIRTWAFYTIVKSALHDGDIPWHKAMISGFIVDPDRKKMSKSRGVAVTPIPLVNKYGADAVRYWASNGRPGMDMAFDENVFTIGSKLVTKLYNAGKFVLMQEAEHGEIITELDRAFVNDLRDTVRRATDALERFEFALALQITETFFWDSFTDNYIELVKRRARSETDPQGRSSAVATLRLGLNTLLRLFAPFVPTITDEVWSWTFAEETGYGSIHQALWPTTVIPAKAGIQMGGEDGTPPSRSVMGRERSERGMPDRYQLTPVTKPESPTSFQTACRAIAAVRKAKTDASIRLGAPLAKLEITAHQDLLQQLRLVQSDVADAGGATEISYQSVETQDGFDATVAAQIEMDFAKDLVRIIKSEFDRLGVSNYDSAKDTPLNIVAQYCDLCNQLISPKRRKVHYSSTIQNNLGIIDQKWGRLVHELERKFVTGENVVPHLTRRILNAKHNDGLLNDYGIHHLHLSDVFDSDGFAERSDYLLFVIVEENDVYFVDIVNHPSGSDLGWVRQDLLMTIHSNWRFLLEKHTVNGITGESMRDKKKFELRSINVNTIVDINGLAVMPPGFGVSLAGTSIRSQYVAARFLHHLLAIQDAISREIFQIEDNLRGKRSAATQLLRFELRSIANEQLSTELEQVFAHNDLFKQGYLIFETTTNSVINLKM